MSRPSMVWMWVGVWLISASPSYADLPVILNMISSGDERAESIQKSVGNLNITTNVGLSIAVVPCTTGSPPPLCKDDKSLHRQYQEWTYQNPTLIDVGQQGRDNSEVLAGMTQAQQQALIQEGFDALSNWGLAYGEPTFFIPPNSSANDDTLAIIDALGFQTFAQVTPACPDLSGAPNRDGFCNSVKLCASGSGASCVLRSYAELQTAIDARASDGAVFVTFT
ncbi:MAG: hypothetical protein ACREQQ_10285, partial [Candidatus Binatia bacterium]